MSTVVENGQILQLLAEPGEVASRVSLDGRDQLLGGQIHREYADADAECGCGGECGCGHQHPSDPGVPSEVPAR